LSCFAFFDAELGDHQPIISQPPKLFKSYFVKNKKFATGIMAAAVIATYVYFVT